MKSLQEMLAQADNKPTIVTKPKVKKSKALIRDNTKKTVSLKTTNDPEFLCSKCGRTPNHLNEFGDYHPFTKHLKEDGEYCDTCFPIVEIKLAKEYLETYGVSHVEESADTD